MRPSILRRVALAAALAGLVGGCNTERRNIPDLTMAAALKLPPDKLPRIFRDPSNPYGYPYNIHETDGLSRNPNDCARWGCVVR
jgi:hypothetical protein